MPERAIESLFAQSYTDWELIIIDDASTDETEDRMKKLAINDKSVLNLITIRTKKITMGLH